MVSGAAQHKKEYSSIYVSDAHLFFGGYKEARTRETLSRLENVIANHDLTILNGDIFEFPFSTLGFRRTVARALSILEFTLRTHPDAHLHYIPGNHDADPVFIHELQKLAQRFPDQFQVSDDLLIEKRYASHGQRIDKDTLDKKWLFQQRSLGKYLGSRPAIIQAAGDAGKDSRIEIKKWAKKSHDYLSMAEPEIYHEAEEIITGHTHMPGMHAYKGKDHYNAGTLFNFDRYAPVSRTLTEKAWAEYLARPKADPVADKALPGRQRKAVARIHALMDERAAELKTIEASNDSYVNRVMRISDSFEKDAPSR